MKKFVVSDLHGCSDIYVSLISYLDNLSIVEKEDVHLYINGDLIDRGPGSFKMLLDVIEGCSYSDNVTVHYIAGNHEQLMFNSCLNRIQNGSFGFDSWDLNGSLTTKNGLSEMSKKDFLNLVRYISNLPVYEKFPEKVGRSNILLAHAAAPKVVEDKCHLKLKSDSESIDSALWARIGHHGCRKLGKPGYFTIVGHTPNCTKHGFSFDPVDKVLNIDGGCGKYANGAFEYDKVPVVEINDGYVKVLVFNHDNKIVEGYNIRNSVKPISEKELLTHNILLDPDLNDCGIRFRKRLQKNHRQQDIDVKIYDQQKTEISYAEDDSDMKIYKK